MNENELNPAVESAEEPELQPVSSAAFLKPDVVEPAIAAPQFVVDEDAAEAELDRESDPVFVELATPKLPQLARENRARLQMQSPNRIFFYWSVKSNPFQVLQKVFGGGANNYQLVVKFVNLNSDREEIRPVDAEGNYWLNVEASSKYRAEIGFYAPNRPYVRVIFSNIVETPRKSPSPRAASDADWAISADKFAQVLDASGFAQDALEVALTGDDAERAVYATEQALGDIVGEPIDLSAVNADEVRSALLALAAGVSLEDLRGQIGEALYLFLREHVARLSAENALAALRNHFEIFEDEILEEETIGAAVFGSSLVNFPKNVRRRTVPRVGVGDNDSSAPSEPQLLPKLSPLSSFSFRR